MRLLAALLLILGLAVPAAAETLVRIEGKNFSRPTVAPCRSRASALATG